MRTFLSVLLLDTDDLSMTLRLHHLMSDGHKNTFQANLDLLAVFPGHTALHQAFVCFSFPVFDQSCLFEVQPHSPVWCLVCSCVFFIHWSVEVSTEGRVTPKINMLTKVPEKGDRVQIYTYIIQRGHLTGIRHFPLFMFRV